LTGVNKFIEEKVMQEIFERVTERHGGKAVVGIQTPLQCGATGTDAAGGNIKPRALIPWA
jgi:hypothetical protein